MRMTEPYNYDVFGEDIMSRAGWILTLFFAAIAVIFALFANGAPASAATMYNPMHDRVFTATLTPGEEVPPTTSTANGKANISVSPNNQELYYSLMVDNGYQITAAHFHCGTRGTNGPAIVFLYSTSMPKDIHGEVSSGVITQNDILATGNTCPTPIQTIGHLTQAMREGKIYVNIHTVQNPQGEIRGQVGPHMPTTPGMTVTSTPSGSRSYALPPSTYQGNNGNTGFDIVQINSLTTGTSRFVVTVPNDFLKQINDIMPQFMGMIMGLFNR